MNIGKRIMRKKYEVQLLEHIFSQIRRIEERRLKQNENLESERINALFDSL